MNRTLASIAIAAAATLGAASSFAGSFPAVGEFSGVEQISAPITATFKHSQHTGYNVSVQSMPAAGEFSAADAHGYGLPGLSREQVRQALANSQPVTNGEVPEAYAAAPSAHTRQEVRQEGRVAMRAGQVSIGDASL